MFSGIIDAVGEVKSCSANPRGMQLTIRAEGYWQPESEGASIAIDGVCLTVTSAGANDASFDVVAETLRRTTLGRLAVGDRVNLQKSLRAGDRIDGHFVQGHVDAIATISRIDRDGGESMWWFNAEPDAMRYIVPKGSVSIDGISLTVAAIDSDRFAVALIPTTLDRTTLGTKSIGAPVNIETDILARTIVHHLERIAGFAPDAGTLTLDTLFNAGFAPADGA